MIQIPKAALVGVMIMVSISTFEWHSIKEIHKVPMSDAVVMLLTMAVVVYTHDLAKGVITGVIISALIFGWRISSISESNRIREDGVLVYTIKGQLFFGTMNHFIDLFEYEQGPKKIEINFSQSHIWDQSAVMGIARVIDRFQDHGRSVYVTGLNEESQTTLDKGFS
ncbi:STAS domain-containing protein [uncultured Methanospirillum sp.]|uniref:STAS domain-containing protein n=1 Tax=uncultured Methanospirillum sp. TaxID=262503 RepID=UPI0029C787F4|nr:STAS domain-containing protein [uncultured Methanospirillum sp.]